MHEGYLIHMSILILDTPMVGGYPIYMVYTSHVWGIRPIVENIIGLSAQLSMLFSLAFYFPKMLILFYNLTLHVMQVCD